MFKKYKLFFVAAISIISIIFLIINFGLFSLFKYEFFTNKNNLKLNFSLINPSIKTLAAEPSNKLLMRVEVRDSSGYPVKKARVSFKIDNKLGSISSSTVRTDTSGESPLFYNPPSSSKPDDIVISANISSSQVKSSIKIKLVPVPIVFVHGYQATSAIFEDFKDYLATNKYICDALDYKSEDGVIAGSKELNSFLYNKKLDYISKGLQVSKFDIIAHSMGGLVTRYYTCSDDYIKNNNVRKIIFVSTPQKGSPWAPLGATYFDDQGIKDLIPDNPSLTKTMPGMVNKGLNSTIEVGSILGQYDEVVSQESASIEEWGIKTELFYIGESNLTVNSLLNGSVSDATIHKNILNNKKVFVRIKEMLRNKLPFPSKS